MKLELGQRQRPRIEMLPLIDIVFLLLVFFIYAMLSMAVHCGLPVDLPVSSTAPIEKELILSITVKAPDKKSEGSGGIFVDDEAVALEDLTRVLVDKASAMRIKGNPEPGVLLFADRSINYQKLFAVLDRINRAGLAKISLQADVDQ